MTHRTNFTISEANLYWLQSQASGERGMSRLIDSLIQKERTLGPIESRMQKQADRLDTILSRTGTSSRAPQLREQEQPTPSRLTTMAWSQSDMLY